MHLLGHALVYAGLGIVFSIMLFYGLRESIIADRILLIAYLTVAAGCILEQGAQHYLLATCYLFVAWWIYRKIRKRRRKTEQPGGYKARIVKAKMTRKMRELSRPKRALRPIPNQV